MNQVRPAGLWFVVMATAVTAIGGFLFGYDTAVINGAISYLKADMGLDAAQEGMAGASAILGCIPGAMCAGFLSDRFGRKKMLFLCAALFAVSGILSALPRVFEQFLAARFLSGLGIGASSIICPVYIAEIAPEKSRGRLGTLFQLGIVTGIFLTLFINKVVQGLGDEAWNTSMGWRWMLGLEALPAIAFLGLLFTVPESPRWLAQRGRLVDKAGRRPLLLVGTAVQAISLGMVGWLFHNHLGGTPLLIAIMAFIAAFAMALGPIGWLFCSEIFPNKVRGRAMSVASFTVWALCYIVAQTFPILNDSPHVGPALTFWIYSGISLLAFLMVLALVPETKGRSLEEIEEYWRRPPRELDPPTAR